MSRDSQTISFLSGVAHGSDLVTDYFKMSECSDKHSPLFTVQVENLHRVLKFRNARHKRLSFPVNRRTSMNFAFCVSPQDGEFVTLKKSGAYRI